jgi:hypothetical protein
MVRTLQRGPSSRRPRELLGGGEKIATKKKPAKKAEAKKAPAKKAKKKK